MAEGRTIRRQRVAIFGLLVALIFTLVGYSAAQAVVDNGDGTANACFSAKNGKLRLATTACKPGKEVATTLNRSVPMFAVVNFNGALVTSRHAVSVSHEPNSGIYNVVFNRSLQNCAVTATSANTFSKANASVAGTFTVLVYLRASYTDVPADDVFNVVVGC